MTREECKDNTTAPIIPFQTSASNAAVPLHVAEAMGFSERCLTDAFWHVADKLRQDFTADHECPSLSRPTSRHQQAARGRVQIARTTRNYTPRVLTLHVARRGSVLPDLASAATPTSSPTSPNSSSSGLDLSLSGPTPPV